MVAKQKMEKDDKFSSNWKGPFVVTRIIGRFQIEYVDDGVKRTASIVYCKKYYEKGIAACRKAKIELGGKRYFVKSTGDVERLVRKGRHSGDMAVYVTGFQEETPNPNGCRLAERLKLEVGGMAQRKETTWKELRGAGSAKEEAKCYTGKAAKKNEEKSLKRTSVKLRQVPIGKHKSV